MLPNRSNVRKIDLVAAAPWRLVSTKHRSLMVGSTCSAGKDTSRNSAGLASTLGTSRWTSFRLASSTGFFGFFRRPSPFFAATRASQFLLPSDLASSNRFSFSCGSSPRAPRPCPRWSDPPSAAESPSARGSTGVDWSAGGGAQRRGTSLKKYQKRDRHSELASVSGGGGSSSIVEAALTMDVDRQNEAARARDSGVRACPPGVAAAETRVDPAELVRSSLGVREAPADPSPIFASSAKAPSLLPRWVQEVISSQWAPETRALPEAELALATGSFDEDRTLAGFRSSGDKARRALLAFRLKSGVRALR
mmetsp:Transcript_16155/g.35605  ORF Transcript_16155/g.35605 Transcript_16155/m.35605 type:complete len:308 (-) Transcript_16155:384-1307(-)